MGFALHTVLVSLWHVLQKLCQSCITPNGAASSRLPAPGRLLYVCVQLPQAQLLLGAIRLPVCFQAVYKGLHSYSTQL